MKKVFCIGLSRTGTTSLHHVFVELGLKSTHSVAELLDDPNSDIVSDFDVLSDTPIPLFYKELDKKYPGSKFILTKRNKQDWLESMKWMFDHGKVIWQWNSRVNDYHKLFYGTETFNKSILSQMYDVFHLDVEQYFQGRQQDLLILELGKRIEVGQICRFLDLPEKKIAYPVANTRRNATTLDRI